MSQQLLELLQQRFGEAILATHSHFGDDTAVVAPLAWFDVARFLRTDARAQMDMLIDLCGVDYPDRDPRFEVVVHLRSTERGHRLRLKTRVGDTEGDGAEVDSLVPIWRGANWFERETFDMYGIHFVGHPDLRRILMYPEFVGYPLRKDYPANRIQPLVEFRKGNFEKLPPFHADEGMSFGRQTHEYHRDDPAMIADREHTRVLPPSTSEES